jgi:S1-C subfamily serine protease
MSDPASPDRFAQGADPDRSVTPNEQPGYAAASPPNTPWSPPATGWEQPAPPNIGAYPQGASGGGPNPPGPPPEYRYGPSGRPPRPRRHLGRLAVVTLLVAAAAFLGVAISNGFWQTTASTSSQGGPTAGSSQNGSGLAPFGSGGGSPFGSGGSGSGGSGAGRPSLGGSGAGGSSSSSASGAPTDVTSIASSVDPALVDINITLGYESGQAAATGIVLTSNGEVLTNNHVINGATSISVTDVGNGRTYKATVVGYDRSKDIAVIQMSGASGLKTAKIGDSSTAAVGAGVVAIGNAGGTGGTPSAAGGTIVALDQQIVASDAGDSTSERLTGLIETNADIQPGDSGGPLVNTAGEVIGIDTAASGGYSFQTNGSQGFAIPMDTAMALVSQIEDGNASATVHIGPTAFLGVGMASSGSFGGGATTSGATISGVLSGTPAAHAGLVAGDVITSVDGQAVDSPSGLSALLGTHKPGDHVSIGWTDQAGRRHSTTVQLATGPSA